MLQSLISVLQSTVTSHPCGPKGVSEYSAYTLTLVPSDQVWKLFPLFIKIKNTKTPPLPPWRPCSPTRARRADAAVQRRDYGNSGAEGVRDHLDGPRPPAFASDEEILGTPRPLAR
jgi:hypothetical protein